jgi:hypothetical protein
MKDGPEHYGVTLMLRYLVFPFLYARKFLHQVVILQL